MKKMEGVEDCRWVDIMIDEIGLALSKADETIQKSINFWKELTKDMSNQELTGQQSNHKYVDEMKEEAVQHWAIRLAPVNQQPIQQWNMCASKFRESLMQTQGSYDCYDNDCHCGDDNETTVSSLKWRGGYELVKDGETSSEEDDESWDDEAEECYSEPDAMEMWRKKSLCDVSIESLVCHDDYKSQEFIDVSQEDIENDTVHSEVETLSPDSDWVYVTRD